MKLHTIAAFGLAVLSAAAFAQSPADIDTPLKAALLEAVDFAIDRAH